MYPRFKYYPRNGHRSKKLKPGRTFLKSLFTRWRQFCMETSMHGFYHIAAPGRHWFERLFWIFITSAAILGAVEISLGQWKRFNENSTVVTLEKDFRNWRFSLPAFTACQKKSVNKSKLPQVIEAYWNVKPDNARYEYYSKFVEVVTSSDLFHLEMFREFQNDTTLDIDLYQLTVDVLPESQVKTTWSEQVNTKWIPTMTEAGPCHVTNSLAIADEAIIKPSPNDTKLFPITCKYSTQKCFVNLEVTADTDFYIHSPYDVADITVQPSRTILKLYRNIELGVMESRCGRGVKELKPWRRGCLYIDEPPQGGRQVYSTNTCRRTCRNRLAIRLCGCKPFYNKYEDGVPCSIKDMACLSRHAQELANNSGEKCPCSPQCMDVLYKEISTKDSSMQTCLLQQCSILRVTVQAPKVRFTREIVFHFHDLVVSFGGAAGLFLGASFISFIEILYFFIEKTLFRMEKGKVIKVKKLKVSHEAMRILMLTSVLEEQRRFDQNMIL